MPFEETAESAHHLAAVVLPRGADRDGIREAMKERGLQTSVHYPPIHDFSLFRDRASSRPLPRTDDVAARLMTLPLFPHMTDDQLDLVVEGLVDAAAAGNLARAG